MTRAPQPDRRRARSAALALVAAGAGLTGCTAAGTDVRVAAATTAAPAATFFSSTGTSGTVPAERGAAVSPEVTLAPALPPVAGSLVVPEVPVGTPPVLERRPDPCGGFSTTRTVVPDVAPGVGSATVSWTADNRAEVLGYRVQAVDTAWSTTDQQVQPLVVETGQQPGCPVVGVTVSGLASGDTYVFWLDVLLTSATLKGTHYQQIGASSPVVVG